MPGKILVVGFGPGSIKHFTLRAREAIEESDCVIGYKTYVDLVLDIVSDQQIISTGMAEEVSRAQAAVKLAESGRTVAVISSGDAGVYGMAGLVYEVLIEKGWTEEDGVEVEVIPGISAINSCASLLGAPVMHDSCTISLSDHLTPWDIIAKRIEAAASADFVIAFYNPRSGRRTRQLVEARNILLQYRSPRTPVGLVKSAYRDRQQVVITTLEDMLDHDIGMLTTVVIGNSTTFLYDNKMITPRGYQRKYTLNADKQALRMHERLRPENEPWALHQGKQEAASPLVMAMEAVAKFEERDGVAVTAYQHGHVQVESIFELAVSPGVANKNFAPHQLILMAEIAGEKGSIQYTPHHQIVLRIPTTEPEAIKERLQEAGLLLSPVGDVLTLKACDFCEGDKKEGIPYAEEIQKRFGGMEMPKELMLGFNGCAMACYGAVKEDIGIVFRRGKFDLFLGAKTVGRTAQAGQPVAEGIEPDRLVQLMEAIIQEYKEKAYPNERFHKYFKRVKNIQGYQYQEDAPKVLVETAPCGD